MFTQKENNTPHFVFCGVCRVTFSIANKGKSDLEQHLRTEKHSKAVRGTNSSNKLSDYFVEKYTKLDDQVSAAEGALAYHTVTHHFSFRSTDCSHKFLKHILPDSSIAKRISCARTKTESIVVNVLAPLSINNVFEDIEHTNFVSILTDASNHDNQKIFPALLQYFKKESGINIKVVDIH